MMRVRAYALVFVFFLILILPSCSKERNVQISTSEPVSGSYILLLNAAVSSDEQIIQIPAKETFPGMTITVPQGAFPESGSITVSYSDADLSLLGEGYELLTPVIHIDTDTGLLGQPVELSLPINLPDGRTALAFYYDSDIGSFEAIPSGFDDDGNFKIIASHFSDILIASVLTDLLIGNINTDFQVGRDNMQIANDLTYIAPDGMCHGMAEATLFYHFALRPTLGPLYERYDNYQRDTYGFAIDDVGLIRLCAELQNEAAWGSSYSFISDNKQRGQLEQWYMICFAMLRSSKPQLLALTQGEWGDLKYGHALIAYRAEGKRIYVADPNFPDNSGLYLEMDLDNGKLESYKGDPLVSYDHVYLIGNTALYDMDRVADMFAELHDGSIGDGNHPNYTTYEIMTDASGNEVKTPLKDEHFASSDTLKLRLESSEINGNLTAYSADCQIIATAAQGETLEIPLTQAETPVGFLIEDWKTAGTSIWVDFKWVTVFKAEMEKWQSTITITEIYPGAQMSAEEMGLYIGYNETEILYLKWAPIRKVYSLLDSGSNSLLELQVNDDLTLYGQYVIAVNDAETISQSVYGSLNDFENRTSITGYAVVTSSVDGDICKLDLLMTRLEE